MLRIVIGGALYLTVAGVFALAIGTLLRNTAAAISAVVGLFFVLPIVFQAMPASIADVRAVPAVQRGWGVDRGGDLADRAGSLDRIRPARRLHGRRRRRCRLATAPGRRLRAGTL